MNHEKVSICQASLNRENPCRLYNDKSFVPPYLTEIRPKCNFDITWANKNMSFLKSFNYPRNAPTLRCSYSSIIFLAFKTKSKA